MCGMEGRATVDIWLGVSQFLDELISSSTSPNYVDNVCGEDFYVDIFCPYIQLGTFPWKDNRHPQRDKCKYIHHPSPPLLVFFVLHRTVNWCPKKRDNALPFSSSCKLLVVIVS